MKFYKTNSFKKIKTDWGALYHDTPNVSPFLNPDAFEIAYRYFFPYYLSNRHLPVLCVFKDNNETIAIIPLLKGRDGVYRLLGAFNGFNECGFVYKRTANLKKILNILKHELINVEFQKIDERSPICQFISADFLTTNNVAICFENGNDDWFKSLSSHTRQNIRTSYNRLKKDYKNLEVRVLTGGGRTTHCLSVN